MSGIYVHIPFCKSKCSYCNFYSITNHSLIENYVNSLIKEIKSESQSHKHDFFETIYIGGGTPSLLSIEHLTKIVSEVFENYNITKDYEFTIELNPDDINDRYLDNLEQLKINRLSIGIQSFDNIALDYLDRKHNSETSYQSIELSKKYFENISIDLIYGIPVQNNETWIQNLSLIKQLDLPHFSCYSLTIEEQTQLWKKIKNNKTFKPSDTDSVEQFEILLKFCEENNFIQYEISNFGKKDYFSKHNFGYWEGKKYVGFGCSAHSYDIEKRYWNIAHVGKYIAAIETNANFKEFEILTNQNKYNEYILTRLRTADGFLIEDIEKKFEKSYINYLFKQLKTIDKQFIIITKTNISLSNHGKMISDNIIEKLMI